MYFNDTSPFNNPRSSLKTQKWDPEIVMGLANQDVGNRITCLGWAASRNRRCQRGPAQHKIASATCILNRLACKNTSKAAGSSELREAADLLLCWQHKGNLTGVLKQWRIELEDWDEDYEDDNSSSATSNKVDPRASSTDDKSRVKEEATEYSSAEELRKMMKQMEENIARLEAELRRRDGKHKKREEEEQKSREEERRRREEEQKRRQEEEDRRKEEEKRREEEARAREKERKERAFRERVRLAKEEREREARRKLEKEAAEWHAAWARYSSSWDKSKTVSVEDMPWPVKSGLRSDVNEANVRLFFAKAPPEELVKTGDKRLKLINAENMRWHTDKVMQRFGPDAVDGAAKGVLGIIAKVMIKLRQEAQKEREA
ncbi:hypothetical protein F4776DRAFT_152567 [Hypoxylon sp. NC0597]|nr:hypothetical protein F4776DRAFT_152567 [Hypoxylon sp. NC0597]